VIVRKKLRHLLNRLQLAFCASVSLSHEFPELFVKLVRQFDALLPPPLPLTRKNLVYHGIAETLGLPIRVLPHEFINESSELFSRHRSPGMKM
jgi:hypothetical protein